MKEIFPEYEQEDIEKVIARIDEINGKFFAWAHRGRGKMSVWQPAGLNAMIEDSAK